MGDIFDAGPDELRLSYHDRIAAIRERSLDVLRFSIDGTEVASRAWLQTDGATAFELRDRLAEIRALAETIDREVLAVLATESPVARDLRVILAARDIHKDQLRARTFPF